MVKNLGTTGDEDVVITNDEEEIRVAQVDGEYSDPDHRPDDEEERLGPDPDHPNESDDEDADESQGSD